MPEKAELGAREVEDDEEVVEKEIKGAGGEGVGEKEFEGANGQGLDSNGGLDRGGGMLANTDEAEVEEGDKHALFKDGVVGGFRGRQQRGVTEADEGWEVALGGNDEVELWGIRGEELEGVKGLILEVDRANLEDGEEGEVDTSGRGVGEVEDMVPALER